MESPSTFLYCKNGRPVGNMCDNQPVKSSRNTKPVTRKTIRLLRRRIIQHKICCTLTVLFCPSRYDLSICPSRLGAKAGAALPMPHPWAKRLPLLVEAEPLSPSWLRLGISWNAARTVHVSFGIITRLVIKLLLDVGVLVSTIHISWSAPLLQ